MQEKHSGDQISTNKTQKEAISEATRLINNEIRKERKRLEDISQTEDADPIRVEGETFTGYYAEIMVEPSKVAEIMLKYNYHFWDTLGQDAPDGMWRNIADMVGLRIVSFVDINLKPSH